MHSIDFSALSHRAAAPAGKAGAAKGTVVSFARDSVDARGTKRWPLVAVLLVLGLVAAILYCETQYPVSGAPWPASSAVIPDAFGDH